MLDWHQTEKTRNSLMKTVLIGIDKCLIALICHMLVHSEKVFQNVQYINVYENGTYSTEIV